MGWEYSYSAFAMQWLGHTHNGALHEALLGLRLGGSASWWLWVDAICINQEDNDEKSMQIPNMMYIYGQATHVVAWLGGDLLHAGIVLETCNQSPPVDTDPRRHKKRPREEPLDTIFPQSAQPLLRCIAGLTFRGFGYSRRYPQRKNC